MYINFWDTLAVPQISSINCHLHSKGRESSGERKILSSSGILCTRCFIGGPDLAQIPVEHCNTLPHSYSYGTDLIDQLSVGQVSNQKLGYLEIPGSSNPF